MRGRILISVFFIFFIGFCVWAFAFDHGSSVDVQEVTFEETQDSSFVIPAVESGSSEIDEGEKTSPIVEVGEEVKVEGIDEAKEVVKETEVDDSVPTQFNLAVPFTSQAPHGNWALPYQEACEEASAYMVWLYFEGFSSGQVNADVADAGILEFIDYENQVHGDSLDITALETAELIEGLYGLRAWVVEDPTVEQIKEQIALGYPIIVPAAGRELGNPNFSGIGPLYHMLVLRGYTKSQWITNDPGTRNGQGYVYDIDVIMSAMGDWNNGDPANGPKRVIFVEPN